MAIERDTVFGGRYVVQSQVGTGGMATVYRGLDKTLDRLVAIKVMLSRYAQDPAFAARFKQEAQAAAALQSPYIVSVYDWGKEGDTYYIIMEYLRGTDLKTGIQTHGAIAPRKVAQIGAQVCSALSVAHKHDIIHRDIKPQNIMIQPNGDAKVMDFGIARAKNSHLTQTNSVLGTAHYVSPEQAQGKELGPTSDLYSLGVVMYEASTGKLPFDGDDAVSVALKQVNEEPVPPSEINPNIPDEFEAIILKCMAKDPAARFQSADELRRVLNNFIAGRPTGVAVGTPTTVMGGATRTSVMRSSATAPLRTVGATQQMNGRGAQPMNRGYVPTVPNQAGNMGARGSRGSERGGMSGAVVVGIAAAVVAGIALVVVLVLSLGSCSGGGTTGDGGGTASSTRDASTVSEQVEVPDLSKLTEAQAKNKLESYGLALGTKSTQASSTVTKGQVISQDPAAGSKAAKGTKVNVVISSGADAVTMPSASTLKGLTAEQFEQQVSALGLTAQHDESMDDYSDDVAENMVCTWTNMNQTSVAKGSTIKYGLSKGTNKVTLPDYTNWGYNDVANALADAGLTMNEVWDYDSNVPQYCVISTDPAAGQQVAKGSTVTVHFSNGPETVQMPSVSGWYYADAENTINGSGLSYSENWVNDNNTAQGYVISTDPAGGSSVQRGNHVTITISNGPSTISVPSVSGWSSSSASNAIANAGLVANISDSVVTTTNPDLDGTVASVSPSEGSSVTAGSVVTITLYAYVAPSGGDSGSSAGTTTTTGN